MQLNVKVIIEHWKPKPKRTKIVKLSKGSSETIRSLLLNEKSRSIFMHGNKQTLKQLNLMNCKVARQYKNLGVGDIRAVTCFEGLLCVGGKGSFSLIDILGKKVLTKKPVNILVEYVNTLQFCLIDHRGKYRVALTVAGGKCLIIRYFLVIH